ncbi:hypothetical protein [Cupriavidus sp. AcVe19-1a]|uniref:hypothetical protein n=1 Tax=Cupriavidus sp. AcVe19-1a TaxID=2821359 RepID=UPI001AEAEACB|nr:hypothetical protein [Cupriavidus sp. AcVe19-1a]MBP0627739.1 hypothetical protein [Cupriavidus sp. AcVe19-1a]
MTYQDIVNAADNCVESQTATDQHHFTCPVCKLSTGTNKRNALGRRYPNDSASVHCMRGCNVLDILTLWGLNLNALRGTDGKLPPMDPGWWRHPRRYDARYPVRPMEEQ